MVAWFEACDALADFLHNACAFMAKYCRKITFWIGTGQRIGIGMANARSGHFYQHFSSLWAFNINLN
jgi:hypothetical protein